MPAIFISYRRNDSEGEAGRLFDDLVEEFGENSVFMDVAAIEAGRDFRKAIDESVATCGVVLALVGKNWLDAKDENGKRRLDDPADFVRLETASALRRDIPVIPVIVRGATMPHADQLPEDLRDLAYRNCVELTHARWSSDLQLLLTALHRQLGVDKSEAPAQPEAAQRPASFAQPSSEPAKIDRTAEMAFDSGAMAPAKPQKSLRTFGGVGVLALLALVGSFLLLSRGVTVPSLRTAKPSPKRPQFSKTDTSRLGKQQVRPDGTQNPGVDPQPVPALSKEQTKARSCRRPCDFRAGGDGRGTCPDWPVARRRAKSLGGSSAQHGRDSAPVAGRRGARYRAATIPATGGEREDRSQDRLAGRRRAASGGRHSYADSNQGSRMTKVGGTTS